MLDRILEIADNLTREENNYMCILELKALLKKIEIVALCHDACVDIAKVTAWLRGEKSDLTAGELSAIAEVLR